MNFVIETRSQGMGAGLVEVYGWRQMARHGRI
jgi:hypothetical protein